MRSGEKRDYVTAPSLGDEESEERVRRELRNRSRSYGESSPGGAPPPVTHHSYYVITFFGLGGPPPGDDSPYDLDLLRNSLLTVPHLPNPPNLYY